MRDARRPSLAKELGRRGWIDAIDGISTICSDGGELFLGSIVITLDAGLDIMWNSNGRWDVVDLKSGKTLNERSGSW